MSSGLSKFREEQDYHARIGNIGNAYQLKQGDKILVNTDRNEIGAQEIITCYACKCESTKWIRVKNQIVGTFLEVKRVNDYHSDAIIKINGFSNPVIIDPMYLKKIQ